MAQCLSFENFTMMAGKLLRGLLCAPVIIFLSGCNKTSGLAGPPQSTLSALISGNPSFSLFGNAVRKAGLDQVLLTSPALTVFAPDNAAFAASGLTQQWIDTNTAAALAAVVRYHIAGSTIGSAGFPVADTVRSLNGNGTAVFLNKSANGVFANGIAIMPADVAAANGVLQVVGRVLPVPAKSLTDLVNADTSLSLFDTAMQRAQLPVALAFGHYTLLAPSNQAFRLAALGSPAAIRALSDSALNLLVNYHVLPLPLFSRAIVDTTAEATRLGTTYTLTFRLPLRVHITNSPRDTARLVSADRLATNGVLHVLDHVLQTQ